MAGGLLLDYFRRNLWQYLILILVFIVGLILGDIQVSGLGDGTRSHLIKLIEQFAVTSSGAYGDGIKLLQDSVVQQVKMIGIVWFLGLTVVGVPLILGLICARGFSLGFTIGFLLEEKGRAGLLMALVTVLPQNLIFVPVLIAGAVFSFNFSIFVIRGRFRSGAELWQNFIIYTLLMAGVLVLCVLGAAVEAFLSPWLLNVVFNHP
ncbi:MAG: stage II sporulation protein M [Ignavibacteriales bacterium]